MGINSKRNSFDKNIKRAYWFKFFRGLHFFSAVLIPFFTLWGKISFTQIMILQAVFTFSSFLLEVPTGVIADKFGRKTSLILAGFFGVIAPIVYVSYPSFWIFALAEFIWAIGAALLSGADSALIYDSLKLNKREKESKKILSRYGSFGLAGILVAAPIGGLIAQYISVSSAMLLTSIPMFIALIISFTFKEPKIADCKDKESYWSTLRNGIKYLRGHKELKILLFNHVAIGTLPFFLIWVYQVILQNYNVPVGVFGFVHAFIVVGEILVLTWIIKLEKFFGGKKKYLVRSAILLSLLFLAMAFINNVYVALACIFLIGAFGLTRKQVFLSYFNKFIESHNRATVLSVVSMVYGFVQAVLYIILGKLIDFNLTVGLVVVGIGILLATIFSKVEEEHLID